MQIYIKIGTMPAKMMHLCRKHKEPELKELIKVKELDQNKSWFKPQSVYIDQIKDTPNGRLFFGELM